MKRRLGWGLAALVGLIAATAVAVHPAYAATGIRVANGVLVEGNGTPLKLRGINHAHTWFTTLTSSFANIKAAGANAIRVVLSGGRWQPANGAADVANVISLCKQNRLICVLENHDTTGFGEQGGAVSLDAAVNYWISVQSALTGQEDYVILNIGNEPIGNNAVTPNWTQATISAVQRLRNAGFQHTIMVDAPNWGQDWQFTMRDNAPAVLAADTTGNLIFSVHMYGVFDTAAEVNAYVDSFRSRNLALCICEFGSNHSDGNPDEDAIMAKAEASAIGMMGWSWSGNSGGVEYLDMVTNFNPAQRSSWGTRFITGANGLSTTSAEATIYSGTPQQPPSTPGTPTASNVTASSLSLSWTASTGTVTSYQIERATSLSGPWVQVGTSSTPSFSNTGLSPNTTYFYRVRAINGAGASAYSTPVSVTTGQTGTVPGTPGTPSTSSVTAGSLTLSWTASSGTVTNYQIERATGATSTTFTQIGTSTTASFNDGGLAANTTYRYRVRATNSAGSSAYSAITNVTTAQGSTGGTCTYRFDSWDVGYVAYVTVNGPRTGWSIPFTLGANNTISNSWNATISGTGTSRTATNMSYNGNVAAGQSTQFGFQASRPAGGALPTFTGCTAQ
jgi:mannan endo-1,4-beta-mannosidase